MLQPKRAFLLPSKGSRMRQELAARYLCCLLLEFAALCPSALRNQVTWLKISFIACHFLTQVHQLQQKQQLTALREQARLEVQESQRFLSDLLQHNSEVRYHFKSYATASGFSKMFLQPPLGFFLTWSPLIKRGFLTDKNCRSG